MFTTISTVCICMCVIDILLLLSTFDHHFAGIGKSRITDGVRVRAIFIVFVVAHVVYFTIHIFFYY